MPWITSSGRSPPRDNDGTRVDTVTTSAGHVHSLTSPLISAKYGRRVAAEDSASLFIFLVNRL